MTKESNDTTQEKLKHGEYKVKLRRLNNHNEIEVIESIVKPLNQEQLADGWLQVPSRKNMIHHFSIYLSQLPMNLWSKVKRTYLTDKNSDYYKRIRHHNYHYSIIYSSSDEKVFELYNNVMSRYPNIDNINRLYKELYENRVKGWLMMRALKMINSV